MPIEFESVARIVAPLLTLLAGAIIRRISERRPRVVSFLGHVSTFNLEGDKPTSVFTHSVVVRNTGKLAAKNLRLGHLNLPYNVRVEPQVEHSILRNADGSGEILINILVPKEQVTVSYLYFPPLTWHQVNTYTKSDEGFAKIIRAIPTPQLPRAANWLLSTLVFIGASFTVYWLIRLVMLVI